MGKFKKNRLSGLELKFLKTQELIGYYEIINKTKSKIMKRSSRNFQF